MLVNATEPEECRIAIVDDGRLAEFYVERASLGSQLGNIYRGRVVNVEPSIGAAFIDFGGPRHGFLSVQDITGEEGDREEPPPEPPKDRRGGRPRSDRRRRASRSIADILRRGQEVIVQVAKDGIGTKGPTLTMFLSLPGRHLVLMPGVKKRGVSRKIQDPAERDRLKRIVAELEIPDEVGIIVRTAGKGTTAAEIKRDLRFLFKLWKMVEHRAESKTGGNLLYQESDLVIRTLRDIYAPQDMDGVVVDSEPVLRRAQDFLKIIAPRQKDALSLHDSDRPLFHYHGVEEELQGLFAHRIELESGGYIFIEQTEAFVSIDINSGRFREEGDLEETAFKINLEAAGEIARQLRLRDLGGVIVNDFIDMRDDDHRRQLEKAFRDALRQDRARIKVARMSPFGLIEMTRQRLRPSLKGSSYARCRHCNGTGLVATPETIGLAVMRAIRLRLSRQNDLIEVSVHPEIADFLVNKRRRTLIELEDSSGKSIFVRGDSSRRIGDYQVVGRVGENQE